MYEWGSIKYMKQALFRKFIFSSEIVYSLEINNFILERNIYKRDEKEPRGFALLHICKEQNFRHPSRL